MDEVLVDKMTAALVAVEALRVEVFTECVASLLACFDVDPTTRARTNRIRPARRRTLARIH